MTTFFKRIMSGAGATVTAVLAVAAAAQTGIPEDSPVGDALARADAAVERIVAVPESRRTFDTTFGAVDDMLAQLELDTNFTMFLTYVSTDPAESHALIGTAPETAVRMRRLLE